MLTAKDISDVLALLGRVEDLNMEAAKDPVLVGKLCAHAFIVGCPLRRALEKLNVQAVPDSELACIE